MNIKRNTYNNSLNKNWKKNPITEMMTVAQDGELQCKLTQSESIIVITEFDTNSAAVSHASIHSL